MKMIAIGLGKQKGADTLHRHGFATFHELIPAVGLHTLAHAPIQFVGSMKIADLNGDGRNDLVVLGQKELAIYYQDKGGDLAAP